MIGVSEAGTYYSYTVETEPGDLADENTGNDTYHICEDGTLTFAGDMFSTYAIGRGYAIEEEPDEEQSDEGQPGGRNRHHAQAHRAKVNKHEVIGLRLSPDIEGEQIR